MKADAEYGHKYTGWVTKRGPGDYQAVVNFGPNPDKPGRYKTRSKSVKGTRGDARSYLRQWLKDLEAADKAAEEAEGKFQASEDTLGKWLLEWVDNEAKSNLERNTYELYRWEITQHIIPSMGDILLCDLSPKLIQDMYNQKKENGRILEPGADEEGKPVGPTGLSNRSVNLIHTVLNQALVRAVALEMIEKNPCDKAKPPRDKKKKRKSEDDYVALSKEELIKFLPFCKDHRDYHIIYVAAYTGARQSELLGLRWSDVNWDKKTIRIAMTLHRYKKGEFEHRPRTKNESSKRTITVTDNVITILRKQELKQKAEKLAFGKGWENKFGLVFADPDGLPIDRHNLIQRFGTLAKHFGRPDFTFHGLRHTHATILLADGEYINVVSKRLGHADVDTTLKVYGHVLPKMAEDAADRFARLVPPEKIFS